jgi:flagellar basal body-associated protein FliL
MKRRIFLFMALVAVVMAAGPAALAQTPDEAAAAARDQGYFIEDGLGVNESSISSAVTRAANEGIRFFVVILDDDPAGGAPTFAGAVLDRLGSGTVLVLSSSQDGMESSEFTGPKLEEALDAAFDAGGGDAGFVDTVVSVLTGTGSVSSGGSSTGLLIMLGIIVLLVALVCWAIRRQKKSVEQSEEKVIAEARREIKGQLDAMANTILDISDQVSASDSKQDNAYLEEAGATYGTALEEYETAMDLRSLESLSDRLDEARWQLDAAAALAYDRPVPPKPEKEVRHQCFFDPNHPEATEIAEITTSAGTKKVRVCKADAEKLRRGQQPKPRMIQVAGRRVPAPMAPRSHGGGGMDWLGVFSVVLGGMAQKRSYDWSRSSRGSTGLFGSGTRRTSSTSSTSSGSSRSSAPKRSRAGRSRRRRR